MMIWLHESSLTPPVPIDFPFEMFALGIGSVTGPLQSQPDIRVPLLGDSFDLEVDFTDVFGFD